MADSKETQPDQINKVTSQKFSDMSGLDKLIFLGKVVVFVCSGGFMYPTLFSD